MQSPVVIIEEDPGFAAALADRVHDMGFEHLSVASSPDLAVAELRETSEVAIVLGRWCSKTAEDLSRDFGAVVVGGTNLLVKGGSAIDDEPACYLPKPVRASQLAFMFAVLTSPRHDETPSA